MRRVTPLLLASFLLLGCEPAADDAAEDTAEAMEAPDTAEMEAAGPAAGTPEWKVENATSAGPPELAANAAVMDWPAAEGGEMTELRPGTNGWTCMPDVPSTPGEDPMCLDATFLEWAGAWQGHTTPQITGMGLSYMLRGGTDASNTDPYATGPAGGEDWVRTGPHIMIVVPDVAMLEGMTTDPASGGPFVMWKGTPYAHIMMPVAGGN